jgi:short-subunit dehydrogenase
LFEHKTFILTGATRGIGYQIAQKLFNNHAKCIFISRSEQDLLRLKNNLKDIYNANTYLSLDVSNEKNVKKKFEELSSRINCIDGIINCAGAFGEIGKFDQVSPKAFLQTLRVNLMGVYNICYFGFPFLKNASRGKIINFSGGGATSPFPCYSGYATSKIALVKLTENLSVEYPTMDINCIAPGFIKTDMVKQTVKAREKAGLFYETTLQMIENGGIDVKYAVDLVHFLLSESSNGITGKLISAPWDDWSSKTFQDKLKNENDFCTLRRIDDNFFRKNE